MDSTSNMLLESRLIAAVGLIALSLAAGACGDPGTTSEVPNGSAGPVSPPRPGPNNPVGPDTSFGVLRGASPVAGVHYQTETHEGLTDEQGRFFYEPGEDVSFRVGSTHLGEAPAQPLFTPFELVPEAEIVTGTGPIERALEEPAFQRVLNWEMLVESLDVDGDPSNGIEISAAVSELLEEVELELDVHPKELARSFALRKVLADAREAFGETRAVVSADRAASNLYAGLEIDPQIYQVVSSEFDRDIAGTIDRTHTVTYDEAGYMVRHVQHLAGFGRNGEPYRVETWQYDEERRPVELIRKTGDVESFARWAYSASGQRETFESGDIGYEGLNLERWGHDEYGNTVLHERDRNGDGTLDPSEAYAYDEAGRIVLTERFSAAGEFTSAVAYEYDEAGRLGVISHIGREGDVGRVETREYDEAGRKVRQQVTYTGDVNPDQLTTFEYDEAGRLTREERDDGNDGTADFVRTFGYDDDGNLVYEETDEGADRLNVATTRRYYDAEGKITRSEGDSDGDGRVDWTQRLEFDAAGNRLRFEWDRDGDGMPNRLEVAAYDDLGNQVVFERWTDEPGLDTYKFTRTFEPTGWGYLMMRAGMTVYGISTDHF
ncbi:MAG: hypothetical protein HKN10_09390 [Myxococcales bacterium]|nr:hypothetical protein [Myxococcales bacterium]